MVSAPATGGVRPIRPVRLHSQPTARGAEGEAGIAGKRLTAFVAGGIALAVVAGIGGFAAGRNGHDKIAVLERRSRTLRTNTAAIAAERDRIRAERDRLETRLAAQNATPKACPPETLSTAQAQLFVRFSVDYPCGWSVL